MRVVLSWLNEFAPIGYDADVLADEMSALGLAVEAIERVGTAVDGVVVARVVETRAHPDAEKVHLVDIDTGDGEPLQIVCGAFNMNAGDLVPLATLGTTMPNGMEIGRRKMRGEWSNGMLCSPRELGLGDDHAGILILDPSLPVGIPLFDALGVTSDVVFDLDVTRNRPDAWSHRGVARDVAAHRRVPFKDPAPEVTPSGPARTVPVTIEAPDLCGRFTSTVLTGVVIAPSAPWMAERLGRAGMRPINNVVDVSNFVMLELGQPNHPYDSTKLGGGAFRVRRARDGETVVTLDGTERSLVTDDLLICDGADEPVGIAGIMGSASSEIDEATTEVALEMAWFDPISIATTAARLGMRTEASARFERGVDPMVIDAAIGRFVELLRETAPDLAVAPGAVDARGDLPTPAVVTVRPERVNALLDTSLTAADIAALIEPIGFTVEGGRVTVPSWRPDCTAEIDIVEEVARHYGYDRLGQAVPASAHPGGLTPLQHTRRIVRQVLVGGGLDEAMPNPFLAPGDLERAGLARDSLTITNPLAVEESILRTSLRPGLLKAVAYNASHRNTGVGLFEVGHIWLPPPAGQPLPDEREVIAVILAGREAPTAVELWAELAQTLGVTGVQLEAAAVAGLHATRSARLVDGDGVLLGAVGEVAPGVLDAFGIAERAAWLEVELQPLHARSNPDRPYHRVSRYPSSDIDLAFVLADDVPAATLTAALRDGAGDLLV
ncbi:MAG TPA: phenylalanine--tRNA ligase subunit beta, partial [Acidimicrobiales bacterium]|nr:phenylalanine--tRNA ligase subunit beta [Acidimicrobiales bacterium]